MLAQKMRLCKLLSPTRSFLEPIFAQLPSYSPHSPVYRCNMVSQGKKGRDEERACI